MTNEKGRREMGEERWEKVNKKENKVYETSYKDKEILELQKKYDSIINNKETPVTIEEAYQSLLLAKAAQKSLIENRKVYINEL